MNRKVFEEDHAICKRVSPTSLAPGFTPIFAESEGKIARFRANIASVLREGEAAPAAQDQSSSGGQMK